MMNQSDTEKRFTRFDVVAGIVLLVVIASLYIIIKDGRSEPRPAITIRQACERDWEETPHPSFGDPASKAAYVEGCVESYEAFKDYEED